VSFAGQGATTPIPPDSELETHGALIGAIHFRILNVFDLSKPEENKALYRLANRLHIRTRESAGARPAAVSRAAIVSRGACSMRPSATQGARLSVRRHYPGSSPTMANALTWKLSRATCGLCSRAFLSVARAERIDLYMKSRRRTYSAMEDHRVRAYQDCGSHGYAPGYRDQNVWAAAGE